MLTIQDVLGDALVLLSIFDEITVNVAYISLIYHLFFAVYTVQ